MVKVNALNDSISAQLNTLAIKHTADATDTKYKINARRGTLYLHCPLPLPPIKYCKYQ
jgi:hypothetical protein